MGQPFPQQLNFSGMTQDVGRDLLPAGMLWNSVDYVPNLLGAPLRKRGGWSYNSRALGTSTYIDAVVFAPFEAGDKTLAVGQDGNVYSFTTSAETNLGVGFAVKQNPVFHRTGSPTKGTVIIPAGSGTTTPKSYDNTTYGNLGGTPPQGMFADVWNDRTLLARGTVGGTLFPTRIWFSPVGNAAGTWDTTNAWVDSQSVLQGIAVVKNVILLFHGSNTERLRGSIPPSATTIGDLVQDKVFDVGCIDARSIVKYQDTVIWADARGVYQTDGTVLKDLTSVGGMRSFWRNTLSPYTTSWTVAAGVFNGLLVVSVMNGTAIVDCFMCDLQTTMWVRLANFPGRCFASCVSSSLSADTCMGLGNAGRVAGLYSITQPDATVKNDANGTAVQPYFETAFYRGVTTVHRRTLASLGLQDWENIYANYDMRDAAADNPTMTISYITDPSSTSYTALSRVLAETTKYTRALRPLDFNSSGVGFKFAQTNASSDTRFNGIELEYSPREGGRLAQ